MKTISIVIPAYNEAESLDALCASLDAVTRNIPYTFLYVLIDDGSTDDTWKKLQELQRSRKDITTIRFTRNFGKEQAIHAGIAHATGDALIVMDSDLQHPPSMIKAFIERWEDTGCSVVHGIKTNRNTEDRFASLFAAIFFFFYERFSRISIANASDFKLIDTRAQAQYLALNEYDLFFRGLIPWIGLHQETITYETAPRTKGCSKWNPFSRLVLAINAAISFSAIPLQIITVFGLLFFLFALALGGHTLIEWLNGSSPEGFTTIILLVLFTGSVIMVSLGVIGQYVAKIYDEVKRRPRYIIDEVQTNLHATPPQP